MIRLLVLGLFIWLPLFGELTRIYVVERSDVLAGRAFGNAGPYERIIAKAHFSLDPKSLQNRTIRDIDLAPKNARGLVEFTADLYVLKPRDPAKGNGTLLVEVPNRGGKGMLSRFMYARSSTDPRTQEDFGDGSLLEQGYTLAWVGWQWDVPAAGANLLRLDAPVIQGLKGLVRSEFVPDGKTTKMMLGDRNHIAYPASSAPAKLTVRDTVLGKRRTIAESKWQFTADRTAIEMAAGFEPGLMYELVYTAENPRLQGAGLAALRDTVAFFKYTKNGLSILGDQPRFIKRAMGFGISQSGRFLRTFLYYAMNEDEQGRKVFDGIWADVAGAGRGSFNHRFAQASRDGYPHLNTLYATDLYPFSDVPQPPPAGGNGSDGLLINLRESATPKIIYTNGSWEYWNRCAALVHTSVFGAIDAPLSPNSRLYFVAGSQHGPGQLPRTSKDAQYLTNPNETRFLQRAVLAALHEWVRDGKEPPPSQYPLLVEEQLAARKKIRWPKTVGVELPVHPKEAYALDFGEEFKTTGIITIEPPKVEGIFPVLLPQVDADGIDLGGVRLPAVSVPLGTFTGWNLRSAAVGAPKETAPGVGSFFPFPKAKVSERYGSKDAYLKKVGDAADKLIQQRFLLASDRERVLTHAAALWDYVEKRP